MGTTLTSGPYSFASSRAVVALPARTGGSVSLRVDRLELTDCVHPAVVHPLCAHAPSSAVHLVLSAAPGELGAFRWQTSAARDLPDHSHPVVMLVETQPQQLQQEGPDAMGTEKRTRHVGGVLFVHEERRGRQRRRGSGLLRRRRLRVGAALCGVRSLQPRVPHAQSRSRCEDSCAATSRRQAAVGRLERVRDALDSGQDVGEWRAGSRLCQCSRHQQGRRHRSHTAASRRHRATRRLTRPVSGASHSTIERLGRFNTACGHQHRRVGESGVGEFVSVRGNDEAEW